MSVFNVILLAACITALNYAFAYIQQIVLKHLAGTPPNLPLFIKIKSLDQYSQWIDEQQSILNAHYEEFHTLQKKYKEE